MQAGAVVKAAAAVVGGGGGGRDTLAQAGGRDPEKLGEAIEAGEAAIALGPGGLTEMRVLALDYGSARCGCALSDPTGTIVTPIEVVPRPDTRRGLAKLEELVREREVERVVVGLPLSLRGTDSEQTRETRAFAQPGCQYVWGEGVPVEMHDERFTTRMAQRESRTPTRPPPARTRAPRRTCWRAG